MFILDTIRKLKNSKRVFFTTPTHRLGGVIPNGLKNIVGYKAFSSDFSEVDGLDNLKHPQNCVLNSQKKAAEIYNTKATFFLTQGSTSGLISAIMSAVKANEKILVARNAHESVFNALVLTGAVPVWFLPDYDEEFAVYKGVTLEKIKNEFVKNQDIKALVITSPTYEGNISEIKEIAEFCNSKGIIFIVDEAHGALYPFSEKLPLSAIHCGADLVVHSLHKTTPALTGSALLHIGKNSKISSEIIQKNLNLITTTSPSWLLIVSVEATINFLNSKRCKIEIENLLNNIENLKQKFQEFSFLNNDDATKLFFSKNWCSGDFISEFLSENDIEDELVSEKGVLLLCGIGTTKKKLQKLSRVLNKFPKKLKEKAAVSENISLPIMQISPKEAYYSEMILVDKENATGEIIGENITPYPPCIPILMAGEVIEKKHLKYLEEKIKIIKKL